MAQREEDMEGEEAEIGGDWEEILLYCTMFKIPRNHSEDTVARCESSCILRNL